MTDLSQVRPMTLMMEDDPALQIVRLKNVGTTPWKDKFNNRAYSMEPGEEIVVPFLAMCLWLGHPDAIDHPSDREKNFRFQEWRRLQVRYGSYDNVGEEPIVTKAGTIPPWKDQVPKIEVLSMAGEPMVTVVDDPEGRHLKPAQQNISQVELMQSALERMQSQMEEMEARLEQATRAAEASEDGDEVRTDQHRGPEQPPPPERDINVPPTPGVSAGVPTAPPEIPNVGGSGEVTIDGPQGTPKVKP